MDIYDYLDEQMEYFGITDVTSADVTRLMKELKNEQKTTNHRTKRAIGPVKLPNRGPKRKG